jgi:hypothetical protein
MSKQLKPKTKMENQNLNFGQAIELLKDGKLLTRSGWNGKGMFLFIIHPPVMETEDMQSNKLLPSGRYIIDFAKKYGIQKFDCLPTFCMKTADNKILIGWLASQSDMQATDWQIFTC